MICHLNQRLNITEHKAAEVADLKITLVLCFQFLRSVKD